MSTNSITVINRTGNTVWVGIDNNTWDPGVPYKSSGQAANGQLVHGEGRDFTVSGSGTYQVGFVTVVSGSPNGNYINGIWSVATVNVAPGALVTLASELTTTGA